MSILIKPNKVLLIGGCGYIGSFLYKKFLDFGLVPTVCDHLTRGNPQSIPVNNQEYSTLSEEYLHQFDAIVWFAGHSSVGQAMLDPEGALANNCLNLFGLAKKLKPTTKLIYASSGSLYSSPVGKPLMPASETDLVHIPYQNPYDISKFAFDYLAEHFLENFYALRMGTLSGFSPNLRKELLFNSMNISAVMHGKVIVKNRDAYRTILFLDDLWLLLKSLISEGSKPGVYNVGSVSGTIGEIANKIACVWGAEIEDQGVSETYSFLLDTAKMKGAMIDAGTDSTIEQRSREFIQQCRENLIL